MLRSRDWFLIGTTIFLVSSLACWYLTKMEEVHLPRLPKSTTFSGSNVQIELDVNRLVRPWEMPPVVPRPKLPAVAPAKVPEVAPDTTSLKYLGMMTREGGVRTYLFKFLPNGTVLSLVEGSSTNGWELTSVSPKSFSIKGPGGMYAAER